MILMANYEPRELGWLICRIRASARTDLGPEVDTEAVRAQG